MANGRKSVLSKDTALLKQIHQAVFESIVIGILFGWRRRMDKTKAKICCKLYELVKTPLQIGYIFLIVSIEGNHPTPTLPCTLISITTSIPCL